MFIDQLTFIIQPDSQYSSVVFYVEGRYNSEINKFIRFNFDEITEYYSKRKIEFCYLPFLLNSKDSQDVIFYNRPYIKPDINDEFIRNIYQRIINQLNRPFWDPGLVMFNSKGSFGFPLDLENFRPKEFYNNRYNKLSLLNQFNQIADKLFDEKFTDEQLSVNRDIFPKYSIPNREYEVAIDETQVIDNNLSEFSVQEIPEADIRFEVDAFKIPDEILELMKKLKETNSLHLLGEMLENIERVPQKLSRIFITPDYRIFLEDYNSKEVFMQPLAKSLYFLFLRYPEGILFKNLSDYYNELLFIYRNISVHENDDRDRKSIRALTDPTNNLINVKCALIHRAFIEVIADNLAKNYYVKGKRGEAKRITLDRRLVQFARPFHF